MLAKALEVPTVDSETLAAAKALFNLDTILFMDFETFFKLKTNKSGPSLSLSTKTYAEYIFDSRFHVTGFGYGEDLDPICYIHAPDEVKAYFEHIQERRAGGERIGICAHNTDFDGSVACWHLGTMFDAYFDTKKMRTLLTPTRRAGLKECAKDEWPNDSSSQKGGAELQSVDGIPYGYITPEQHEALGTYCVQDTSLMRRLFVIYFRRIADVMGAECLATEMRAIHITLRGAIEPQFAINDDLLHEVVVDETASKAKAVCEAIQYCMDLGLVDVTDKTFSSNPQYAELLKRLGIVVPMKMSPTTFEMGPALGNTDPEYIRTQIDYPQLAPVFKARREVKSTIALSRAKRMLAVADMFRKAEFPDACMPFFLNYYGADQTGRWSGGQKLNQQNNTRGGKHRLSMEAPPIHVISVCDLSNIELRVNLWFCGQDDLLQNFRSDPNYDLYSAIASDIFRRPINKHENKNERQMGKAAALGLGFAMGWFGFQQYLASGPLGMEPMFESDDFCKNVKNSYDAKHYGIKAMWHYIANTVIPTVVNGGVVHFGPGMMFKAEKDKITLPSGRILHYPNARYRVTEDARGTSTRILFDSSNRDRWGNPVPKNLWHGLLLENIVQATARDVLCFQLVEVDRQLDEADLGWVMGSVHDELLSAVLEDRADEAQALVASVMSTGPDWAMGLPLANEGGWAKEYSK